MKLAFVANKNTLWVSVTCNESRRLGSIVGLDVVVQTVQGDSGGLGLGNVDSVPSQDNLQMRRN